MTMPELAELARHTRRFAQGAAGPTMRMRDCAQ